MKLFLLLSIIFIFVASCSRNSFLKKYYDNNIELHQSLADSLMHYTSRNKTQIILRKKLDGQEEIYFNYYFKEGNIFRRIEFDTFLNRIDMDSSFTSQIAVPIETIKLFKKCIYTAVIADNSEVFFGYEDNFDGNSKYGIVIDLASNDNSKKHIQKLAENVYITRGVIP
jgi:hypothetical protein